MITVINSTLKVTGSYVGYLIVNYIITYKAILVKQKFKLIYIFFLYSHYNIYLYLVGYRIVTILLT
ncbi:hypothetical protein [Staphylococcus phage PT1-4]